VVSDLNLNLLGRYLCFSLAALGIGLIWGYAGILSLCQAFFFCLGGYCIGMHMLLKTGTQGVYGSALPDFMVWTGVAQLPFFWITSKQFWVSSRVIKSNSAWSWCCFLRERLNICNCHGCFFDELVLFIRNLAASTSG
jgi:hypothetical protein